MLNIIALCIYKNKYPHSNLERIGDWFISPITILLNHHPFVVLKNDQLKTRWSFTYTNSSTGFLLQLLKKLIAIVLLPIAIVGIAIKLLSLIFSPQTREIYSNWVKPYKPKHSNPAEVKHNYFSHEENIIGFAQRGENFILTSEAALTSGCLPQFFDEVLNNQAHYLLYMHDSVYGDQVYMPPYLYECACVNSGNFNRFSNNCRLKIENRVIKDALDSFTDKTQQINYLSLGAGGLLQDFILINKLLQQGHKNVYVVLIDPAFKNLKIEGNEDRRDIGSTAWQFAFLKEIAKQRGAQVVIETYKTLSDYKKVHSDTKFELIQAIDFDDFRNAFLEVIEVHKLLTDNGKFYLSYGLRDFVFSKERCLSYDSRYQIEGEIAEFLEHLPYKAQQFNQTDATLNYTLLGEEFSFEECLRILPKLGLVNCNKVSLKMIEFKQKDCNGQLTKKADEHFTKEALEYFLKLFLPKGKQIEIGLFTSFEDFQQRAVVDSCQLISLISANEKGKLFSNIKWLRTSFPNAVHCYNVE